ncbi:hypothetical protein COLINT_02509 [Collinsella intestinalis DSM 13280]|uniref:Uncharacterized protein n=1 Tax=Collinsella intestinalis DSM 13280 TaxID=521003 RepID=C4F8Y3_9ACTN|nr:hypothetical protein COLINT_02509 [Collinsella intestinalis DSM 13280]
MSRIESSCPHILSAVCRVRSQALGWLTPDEHRLALEYAV